uniref:Uncharacterized protein n=1 Tax=Anguilla anguilla TaxID=7936 RepID=A0A0E9W525_ANGAN
MSSHVALCTGNKSLCKTPSWCNETVRMHCL